MLFCMVLYSYAKPLAARIHDLMVFGRFRPCESRGLAVDDEIVGAAILSSLQSEDNPTGEWIEAWLIASADRNAWLFEVNHSARWYYNWGSSAAKDKRLKEHVFEVYVLYQANTSAASDAFRVVAVACSPSFKLQSFRRAPSETHKRNQEESMLADGYDSHMDPSSTTKAKVPTHPDAQVWANETPLHLRPGLSPSASRRLPPSMMASAPAMIAYSHAGSVVDRAVTAESTTAPGTAYVGVSGIRTAKRPRTTVASRHEIALPPRPHGAVSSSSSWSPRPDARGRVEMHTASPPSMSRYALSEHGPRVSVPARRTQLDDLLMMSQFVRGLPLVDIVDVLPSLVGGYHRYVAGHGLSTRSSPHDRSSSVMTVRHIHRLLVELGDVPSRPQTEAVSPRSRSVSEVANVAAHLGLWLAFDPTVRRTTREFQHHAAMSLLARPSLIDIHEQYIAWLHGHVDAYLRRCGWSVNEFVDAVSTTVSAVQTPSPYEPRVHVPADGSGLSFVDFVAQARELFAFTQEQHGRWYRLRSLAVASSAALLTARHRNGERTSLFNGVWRCDVESVKLRRFGHPAVHEGGVGGQPPTLQSLLWFWQQFDNVQVTLQPTLSASEPRALEVASLLKASPSDGGLRLVLDGRARWFRSFPSGESTSSVAVGGQLFGDYRAVYASERNTIECVLYSWPLAATSTGGGRAYCWRFVVQAQPTGLLCVQLLVECGALVSGVSMNSLMTSSLEKKVNLVRRWKHHVVAEWVSQRLC